MLLCYEVTRDLPLTDVEIQTPLARMRSAKIAGKKLVFVPVLRAGVTFVDGMLDLGADRPRRAYRALSRAADICRGRIFLQVAVRSQRAAGDRGVAGSGDREYGGRGGRPAQGARRQRYPDGDACLPRPKAWSGSGDCIRMCRYGPLASTRDWTTMPSSCPALATPATALTARDNRPREKAPVFTK